MTKSNTKILTWSPTMLDVLANKRNKGDIIQARQRIQGFWSHNRFFNYSYSPSESYFKAVLKYKLPLQTKKVKL